MTMSPTAIRDIGNVLLEAAFDQVAKDRGLTREALIFLKIKDDSVSRDVKAYMLSGLNFASSKI